LEALEHKSHLYFEFDVGRKEFVLAHDITQAARHVGAGPWKLTFDVDGRGLLEDPRDEDNYQLVEDILQPEVMVTKLGQMYLQTFCGDEGGKPELLLDLLLSNRLGTAVFPMGPGNATCTMECICFFSRPRANGNVLFWNLLKLFSILDIQTHLKRPSKWSHDNVESWSDFAAKSLTGMQYCHSKHANRSLKGLEALPVHDRIAPWPSLATTALMTMLWRCSSSSTRRGGMVATGSRDACRALFLGMTRAALWQPGCSVFRAVVVDTWKCRWPLPPLVGDAETEIVEIPLNFENGLDLTSLLDCRSELRKRSRFHVECYWVWSNSLARNDMLLWTAWLHPAMEDVELAVRNSNSLRAKLLMKPSSILRRVARCWGTALTEAITRPQRIAQTVPFDKFMQAAGGDSDLDALMFQLIAHLGKYNEDTVQAGFEGHVVGPGAFASGYAVRSIAPGRVDTDEMLYAYVAGGLRAAASHRSVGCATDKANPASGSITNTVFSLPNNEIIMACPSVSAWERGLKPVA